MKNTDNLYLKKNYKNYQNIYLIFICVNLRKTMSPIFKLLTKKYGIYNNKPNKT